VTMEVEAPCNGKLIVIEVPAGSETNVGDVVCQIETS
jgi:pyruvate/2-oxoglutarate dehydrogenase complex dihydrolipoamide acyltransferase (E2) component